MRGRIELAPGIGFRLSTNALIRYEEAAGETFFDALKGADNDDLDLRRVRLIIWAGLEDRDRGVEETGDLIDDIGLSNIGVKIGEAVRAAFPDAVKKGKGSGNSTGRKPPKK